MRLSRPLFAGGMLALCLAGLHAGCAPEGPPEENAGGATRTMGGRGASLADVPRASERPPGAVLQYDPARRASASMRVGGDRDYEASLARRGGERWMAWLVHEPRVGDSLQVARLADDGRRLGLARVAGPAMLANPRLTVEDSAEGRLFLSWEERGSSGWSIRVTEVRADGSVVAPLEVSPPAGDSSAVHVSHDVAALPEGGLWFAWRTAEAGAFRIAARKLGPAGDASALGRLEVLPLIGTGAWDPRIACDRSGAVALLYEAFTDGSFDVILHRSEGERFGAPFVLASGPRLQYHPRVLALAEGGFLCAWEEGALGWGAPFSARKEKVPGVPGKPSINELRFDRGPLHRARALRFATVKATGEVHTLAEPFPMPALTELSGTDVRRGAEGLGGFYERAELVLDGGGRPWCVWRHYVVPELGSSRFIPHHVFDEGWRIYARSWNAGGWSAPFVLDRPQRDGGQSMSLAPDVGGEGIEVLWSVGRHDRYRGVAPPGQDGGRDPKRGLRLARVVESAKERGSSLFGKQRESSTAKERGAELVTIADSIQPHAVEVGGERYRLRFGDLHRHTDVSLCNAFLDGTLQDTYRYAIEAGRLDFVAITDHTWDIDLGAGSGLTWWRGVKAVSRHRVPGRFTPFHGFERSSGNTDHNFISLQEDLIFDHPAQQKGGEKQRIEEVWRGLDERTLTLPHQPVRGGLWEVHDEERRPLMEVYQGFRTEDVLEDASDGLERGFRFGFVASSDHLSTSASYAGVWAAENTPEAIFAALRARRTFAATVPMSVVVRAGDAWMGEHLESAPERIDVLVRGTAPIAKIEAFWSGGRTERVDFAPTRDGGFAGTISPPADTAGEHWVYVRIEQEDGGLAWSSPLWFSVTD